MNTMYDSDSQQFSINYLHQVGLFLKPVNIGCIVTFPMKYGLLWVVSLGKLIGLLIHWFLFI